MYSTKPYRQKIALKTYSPKHLITYSVILLWIMLSSCHKMLAPEALEVKMPEVTANLNSWLTAQIQLANNKPAATGIVQASNSTHAGSGGTNRSVNIELLKDNIDLNSAEIVPLSKGYSIVVMPVNDQVRQLKKLDAGSSLVFVACINAKNEVKWANIVYYKPDTHESVKKLDAVAVEKLLSGKPSDRNGVFYFLSISGRRQSRAEYRNGKLYSNSVLSAGSENDKKTNQVCIDWWEITTIHYTDGSTETFKEYLGQTCSGCEDLNFMSLCPSNDSGGGDSSCSYSEEEALQILADASFTLSSKQPTYSYGSEYEAEDENGIQVSRWPRNSQLEIGSYYIGGALLTYTANFTGVLERSSSASPWRWINFAYANTVQSGGTPSPCINPETTTTCSTSIDPDGLKARANITFDYKGTVVCVGGKMQGQAPKSDTRNGYFPASF